MTNKICTSNISCPVQLKQSDFYDPNPNALDNRGKQQAWKKRSQHILNRELLKNPNLKNNSLVFTQAMLESFTVEDTRDFLSAYSDTSKAQNDLEKLLSGSLSYFKKKAMASSMISFMSNQLSSEIVEPLRQEIIFRMGAVLKNSDTLSESNVKKLRKYQQEISHTMMTATGGHIPFLKLSPELTKIYLNSSFVGLDPADFPFSKQKPENAAQEMALEGINRWNREADAKVLEISALLISVSIPAAGF